MKKKAVATAVAGMMMVSNMAFAGFGLPSLGGALGGGNKKEVATETAKPLDLSGVTGKQELLLRTMNAGMIYAAMAQNEIGEAMGQTDKNLMATVGTIQKNLATDKKDASKLGKELKSPTAVDFDKFANGTDDQKAKLKEAMGKASGYKQISDVLFVAALAQAPGVLSETSSMLGKTKDFNVLGTLNGIIGTCKQANSLNGVRQKFFSDYAKNSANAKALLKPTEVKLDAASLKKAADNSKDGNFNF